MEPHQADVVPKIRLDQLLVARGLTQSRERARALILAGDVSVEGRPATKAGTLVAEEAAVTLRAPDHPWVGRGGIKLAHALDVFGIEVTGATVLDVGASTGGFTNVLLDRGAAKVVALDVGRNQLDWRLRSHPRVISLERVNARHLKPGDLPSDSRLFRLITVDVSFISLRLILPVLPPLLEQDGRVIALVKPQFEAGRDDVGPGGLVTNPALHARVLDDVTAAALQLGLSRLGLTESPIQGAEGNREFLLLLGQQ